MGLRAEQQKERTRRMLDAAAKLFNERGYEATRVEDIAAQAGVAAATVYNYFSNKPSIILALADRHFEQSFPERQALVEAPPDSPLEAVMAYEALLIEQLPRLLTRECWRVVFSAFYAEPGGAAYRTASRLNGSIRHHYRELLRHFQRTGGLPAEVDVTAMAEVVFAIDANGLAKFLADETMSPEDWKRMIKAQLALVFHGLDGASAGGSVRAAAKTRVSRRHAGQYA